MTILKLKKIIVLILLVISFLPIAHAKTKADSLEALLPGLQGSEKIEVFEQLIELNTISAPEKAIGFGRKALELLEDIEDAKMEISILNKMCSAYMRVGKDSIAIKLGNKSLELAVEVNDMKGQAGALNEIGNVYRKTGEYQKALDYYSRSMKIYEELNDIKNVGSVLKNYGRVIELSGNFIEAMSYYQKSLKIFEETDDKNGIAMLSNCIGKVYGRLGEYERDLEYSLRALKINEQIDNKMGIANSLGNIGVVYWGLEQYDKALDYNLKSLIIKEEIGDKWSISPALVNVGVIYAASGDYTHALQYYFKSLELSQEIGDKHNIKIILNNIGNIYYSLDDSKSALEYFIGSLEIAEEIGDKHFIALGYSNIGKIHRIYGKYQEAINYETKALVIGKNIKSKQVMKICYDELSEIYANMGDFENALHNHKLFKSINDSIFTEESSKKIAEMQIRYETEKKEKEIELLKNESKIQSLEMDKQKNYRNLAVISSVFILFVTICIFIVYRLKIRSNKLLISLNEEIKQSYEKLRVQAEDLQISKNELQAANNDLEAFSYSVSHDLRTPLRAINGFSKILSEDYKDKLDNEANRIINVINENVQKMNRLITDMLDFSRLGRQQLKTYNINMKNLAADVVDEFRQIYPKSHIEFKLGDIPPAMGDRNLIHIVFTNLLSNAIKFSKHKKVTEIEIGYHKKNKQFFYYVKDNGVGFDMKYVDKIFGVFRRLHTSEEFEGSGVGLAIVQKIIQKHNGKVIAEGEVDKGATIYFSLPRE